MNHAPFRPLDDCPLDCETAQSTNANARLQPTVDCITGQLEAWLLQNQSDTNPSEEAPRIGLFGGLGQGKSTVLNLCLEDLRKKRETQVPWLPIKFRNWLFGPPIARFDVSHFKAEDLEWRFLNAVLWQRIWHAVWWVWLPLFVMLSAVFWGILTVVQQDAGWQPDNWWLDIGLPGLISTLLAGWSTGWLTQALSGLSRAIKLHDRLSPAANLYVSRRDWRAHVLAELTGTLPRVVIVDDLDRAKVDQQRAFLRAILRFSRQMHFAVVVCMDESAVLASKPDPEAPEELLRKTIQLELHLPDRSREDIAFLAINLCHAAASLNERRRALLLCPQWIGDLVRCLLLLGPIGALSPRRIKHFLNAVMARVAQLNAQAVDDCCALLRLEGLLTLLPELRRHPSALLDALETNRVETFEQILSYSTTSSDNHITALRYFAQTRSMQPQTHDGWYSIISGSPFKAQDKRDDHASAATLAVPTDLRGRSLELLRLMSMAIDHLGQGYARSLHLSADSEADREAKAASYKLQFTLSSGSPIRFDPADLPTALSAENAEASLTLLYWPLWLGALAHADATVRNRLYRCVEQWLQQIANHDEVHKTLSDLLTRERLADHEVWPLLPQREREHLLKTTHTHATLASHRLTSSALQGDELEHAMTRYLSVGHRNAWRDAKWLSAHLPARPSEELLKKWPDDISALLPIWPSRLAGDDQDWFGCLRSQTGHELAVGTDGYELPHRLAASWRVWGAEHLGVLHCLDILQEAAYSFNSMYWSLPRLAAWLNVGNPTHAPAFATRYPAALGQLVNDENALDWSKADFSAMTPLQHLTAVAVAYHCDWRLTNRLVDKLTPVPIALRRSLVEALLTNDPSASKWLPLAEQKFIATLLREVLDTGRSEDNELRLRWQALISNHRPSDAAEIFAALRWPPPELPLP